MVGNGVGERKHMRFGGLREKERKLFPNLSSCSPVPKERVGGRWECSFLCEGSINCEG